MRPTTDDPEDLVANVPVAALHDEVEDLREPQRADYKAPMEHFGYRGRFVAPYVRLKARRQKRNGAVEETNSKLWLPTEP